MRVGSHKGQWGSLSKLQSSIAVHSSLRTAIAALGANAVIWDGEEIETENYGTKWLEARNGTIGGGTSEMQRNIIASWLGL